MKTETYFLLASLMLVSLLFDVGSAAALDTNAHAAANNSCTGHLPSSIPANYTFSFCRFGSQATKMKAEIRNQYNKPITACTPNPTGWQQTDKVTITCNGLPTGTIKAKVFWYVGNSPQMEHPDTTKR
jgi:hypothetical protein